MWHFGWMEIKLCEALAKFYDLGGCYVLEQNYSRGFKLPPAECSRPKSADGLTLLSMLLPYKMSTLLTYQDWPMNKYVSIENVKVLWINLSLLKVLRFFESQQLRTLQWGIFVSVQALSVWPEKWINMISYFIFCSRLIN